MPPPRVGARASLVPAPNADFRTLFHPAVAAWFAKTFRAPTAAQAGAWPAIKAGRSTLIAAPTGSGKTLSAFLAALDDLVRQGLEGTLTDATQVVYVSPLKALSNDIHRNLDAPLAGIRSELERRGLPEVAIRTWVRTGDTAASERARMHRRPPHIVVTTPESLYVLLGSESGRKMLATTRSVIVDEIHAVAPEQARRASRLVARAPLGALRRPAPAHRPLGDAEPDSSGREPARGRRRRRRPGFGRRRSSTPAISARATLGSRFRIRRSRR